MAVIVPAIANKVIHIGRAGENLATTVQFDVADWIKPINEGGFGSSGTFSLFVQQGGGQIYPQNLVEDQASELDNNIVEWNITDSNTATIGLGKCELVYSINTGETDEEDNPIFQKVKSVIYDIVVTNSLDIEAQGNIPSAIDSWLNEISEMVDQINDAASNADKAERYAKGTSNGTAITSTDEDTTGYHDNAKYYSDKVGNMSTTTTTSGAGTNASVEITTVDNHYNLAFTIPRGNTGSTGATGLAAGFGTPTASITNTVGTPSVNITTDGPDTAKIFNFAFSNLKGDKGDQGDGFAGTLNSLPTANAANYNIYKDKVYIYDSHVYSIIQSNGSYSWVDGGTITGLPSQTNNSGKYLTTNGTTASWATVDALPSQTNNSGKYLTTNGTIASWSTVDALPLQSGNSGKYLTTNGTTASWESLESVSALTVDSAPVANSTNLVTSGGVYSAISNIDALPSQSGNSGKYLTTNGSAASWVSVSFVPTSRTINSKALSSDITLNASDIGALSSSTLGAANGVASLTSDSKVTPTQITAKQVTISSNTTLTESHNGCRLLVTGSYTITVPYTLSAGFECEIVHYGTSSTHTVTIAVSGTTLNGSYTSITASNRYDIEVLTALTAIDWHARGDFA